jgi:hypothetical protein
MPRETWVALPLGSRRLCLSLYCLSVSSQAIDLMKPAEEWVPTRAVLVHQTFISGSDFPQVAEGRCGYAGSNKAISVERDSIRKEQLLEPLTLVERRLHPQICSTDSLRSRM